MKFKPTGRQYENIENIIKPEYFFDIATYQEQKRIIKIPVSFHVNDKCYSLIEKLLGFHRLSMYSFARGLIGTGGIVLAHESKIMKGQVQRLIKDTEGARKKDYKAKMIEILSETYPLRKHPEARKRLEEIARKYGNNKYNQMLKAEIEFKEDIKVKKQLIPLPTPIKQHCMQFVERGLDEYIFLLQKENGSDSKCIKTRPPKLVDFILRNYREEVKKFSCSKASCYRAALIIGLHIFSKWLLENKLNELDEFTFVQIYKEIELVCTDDYEK